MKRNKQFEELLAKNPEEKKRRVKQMLCKWLRYGYRILLVTLETVVCIAIITGVFFGINTFLKVSPTPIEYAITVAYFAIFLHFMDKEDSYE